MIIRIKAKAVANPCIFRNSCQGACDWCKTHSYTEECVGMAVQQAEALRKNWVAAENEKKQLLAQMESMYTLDEIADAICDLFSVCDEESCPGFYYCGKGKKGTLVWLRKVMGE